MMRRNNFIFSLLLTAGCVIIQSTFMHNIEIYGVIPDIALIVIVFSSNSSGPMRGQILGFSAGLIQDFLSACPLGFNALNKTITGFIYGKLKGKLFLDSILLPVIFVVTATIFKEIISSLEIMIFLPDGGAGVFGKSFFIELGLNAFLSPFIFALLKLLKIYRLNDKDGY